MRAYLRLFRSQEQGFVFHPDVAAKLVGTHADHVSESGERTPCEVLAATIDHDGWVVAEVEPPDVLAVELRARNDPFAKAARERNPFAETPRPDPDRRTRARLCGSPISWRTRSWRGRAIGTVSASWRHCR